VQCLLWESAIFAGTSLIRLALNYLRPPLPRLMDVARHLYSFVAILHFFLFFTYIGTVSAWLVVAAALEPSRFLPYGMAVLVVLFVGGSVYHQMQDAAKRMKMLVKAAFERMMQAKLKRALKTIHERLRIAKRVAKAMEPPSGDDEEEAEEEALMQEAEGKTVSPADVFAAINVNGDDELDMAEFTSFFELLELQLTKSQKEQLFAFCDADCSGRISEKEFTNGWEKLVQVFLERSATNVGVSNLQILFTVAYLVFMLSLLLAFVLVALAAWNTNDSFIATVQSGLVVACGRMGTALRQRGRAEQGNVDGLVGDIMKKQVDDAAEDTGEVE